MKKIMVAVLIIALATIFYFWLNNRQPASGYRKIKPRKIEGKGEKRSITIVHLIWEAKAELVRIQIAAEAYHADYDQYPDYLRQLTTPASYLQNPPQDPFTLNSEMGYRKLSDTDYLIWSIGPDLKDQDGLTLYSQRHGLESEGDIVWTKTIRP